MSELLFSSELTDTLKHKSEHLTQSTWKVLIVDDEDFVHQVTRSVLENVEIDSRTVELISAYSGKEALEMLHLHDDIAVIFLDVVMETDNAGLQICKDIREKLNNEMVQIILRTGQPGANPEHETVLKYKINDYKDKTELSAQKLFTCLVSALRSYQDLVKVKQNKIGLDKIIIATQQLSKAPSIPLFMDGVLSQLITVIDYCERSFVFEVATHTPDNASQQVRLMSSFGWENNEHTSEYIEHLQQRVVINRKQYQPLLQEKEYACDFYFGKDLQYVLYLEAGRNINNLDLELLQILSTNIQSALENLYRYQQTFKAQNQTILQLTQLIASQDQLQSERIASIALISYQLALDCGLNEQNAEKIRGALTLFHGDFRPDLLSQTSSMDKPQSNDGCPLEQLALLVVLAQKVDECYDGRGAKGLAGDEIEIEVRIVALARVFYGAISQFKQSNNVLERTETLLMAQAGKQVDPNMVSRLLQESDKYLAIMTQETVTISM